ncbi:PAS domain S-box protein [Deinococcus hopiensis]|uniref:histidine kinase n=1 Tax=Deinococcus hopiensis KR-140 TaxID=695939 RepID=A0A1W1VGW4_9DEIO|nr:PAS domain S-box protein [Deinococcus hopiensis]SMB92473.1 PAS domain S-box-containing protein [Deinococcus hopiensis KR-140]
MSTLDRQLEALLDLIDGVVWEADPVTRQNTFVSAKIRALLGYTPAEWQAVSRFWDNLLHPDDRGRTLSETERAIASGRPYRLEYRLRAKGGRWVWLQDIITPVREDGELRALGGVMIDVTEQKRAREALHGLEQRYGQIFQASPIGMTITALADLRILEVNEAFVRMTGHAREDLLGHTTGELRLWAELEQRPRLERLLRRLGHLRERETVLHTRTGEARDVLVSGEYLELGGEPCALTLIQDVTGRKRTERHLRRVEGRFRSLVQNSVNVYSILDERGVYTYISPAARTVHGVEPEAMIGLSLFEQLHHEDLARAREDFATLLQHPAQTVVSTYRHRSGGGAWRWLEVSSSNLLHDDAVRGIVCNSMDITERKEAEAALERSEGRFRSLVQHASDLITVLDVDGNIIYESPSITSVLGHDPDAMQGQNAFAFVHEDDHLTLGGQFAALIEAGPGATTRPTFRFRAQSGEWHTLEALATNLLADPHIAGIVVNSRDVTERVQAEARLQASQAQLLSSEKLASLGRLTAGLAHEINTPLAAAMNYLHEARTLIEEYRDSIGQPEVTPEDHREIAREALTALEEAGKTTARIGEFIRQMRGHTRDTVSGVQEFDPAKIAGDTLTMLAHEARAAKVALHLETPRHALTLRGEPGRFTQVLTNLVINAVHACEAVEDRPRRVDVRFVSPDGDLAMEVEDNGTGIPEHVLTRIFDPLFTTKDVGKGTGLGLSIIHDIVTGHFGGTTEVQTEPGRGTTFTVRFGPSAS